MELRELAAISKTLDIEWDGGWRALRIKIGKVEDLSILVDVWPRSEAELKK